PLITVAVLGSFVLYATWRAFDNQYYEVGPYLSPFYSPLLAFNWSIAGWNISPALYILVFPLSFRLTCYYYRLAYYRAFFWDPPACAVPELAARKHYTGERQFPFLLQNLHRFALYAAIVFIFILGWDAIKAFIFDGRFGIGLGSLIFLANIVLLALYTFSCHSFRHLIGGRVNCYSCTLRNRTRHGIWQRVSMLNERHGLFAWCSLVFVAVTDLYVRLVASGAIHDLRFF
ncbi:MAG TPA: succinate dehydrogenase, partial [Chloroflexia bacterium]|nr:succinate dehydrogenase [Chloroflexia bacterium]